MPGGSELVFDIELLEFKSRAEVEAMPRQMQEIRSRAEEFPADPLKVRQAEPPKTCHPKFKRNRCVGGKPGQ